MAGGDEDLHGLEDDAGLGAPLHDELALVPDDDGPADLVGGDDEGPVHLGLHPLGEVGVEGAGVLDAGVAVDEGVVADAEAGAVARHEADVDLGVLSLDDVGELPVAPLVGPHHGGLGGVGAGVVDGDDDVLLVEPAYGSALCHAVACDHADDGAAGLGEGLVGGWLLAFADVVVHA